MISGRLYSGPTYSKFFEQSSYELGYTIHDSKIYDGKRCTDYERMNSSYGNCVDSIMKRHLLECYGCLPPWFPAQKGMICESDKIVVTSDHAKCKGLKRLFAIFYLGRNLKMFESCMPPCLKMSISLKRTSKVTNGEEVSRLSIVTKNEVVVMKATYSYDIFSLIVDIGSALGLWLGLSALSLFDNIIILTQRYHKKINKKKKVIHKN